MRLYIRILIALVTVNTAIHAAVVSGRITDSKNEGIPYVNVFLKGSTKGTTANQDGNYNIELAPGSYELVFKMLGYISVSKQISVGTTPLVVNIIMQEELYQLNEVVINSSGEDPAYPIIRKAIDKRKFYLEQVDTFSCDVYIKGLQRLTSHPKKILGKEVDPEKQIDTISGIIYFSESVSKYAFAKKDKIREEMISSKVSGNNRAFSYNKASDMKIDFYENLVMMQGLAPRGFVSPIANNALFFYKYKLVGSFFENEIMIHKIQVTPKRESDPAFSGYIYISDISYRIHSTDLYVTKKNQLRFIDTLKINQTYLAVDEKTWMLFQNKLSFSFSILKFTGNGVFLGVYSNYNVHPNFPSNYFSGEEMKVLEESNKKDSSYWEKTRPVPLTEEEKRDYVKKDSMHTIRTSKRYLDSLDKKLNKVTFSDIILNGITINKRHQNIRYNISSLTNNIQYNTVQGWVMELDAGLNKQLEKNRYYTFRVNNNYGFANKKYNALLQYQYSYNPVRFAQLNVSAGRRVIQYNATNPIGVFVNSVYSLFDERNYLKLFQKTYLQLHHRYELLNGLICNVSAEYSERMPLKNNSNYTVIERERTFTSNNPLLPLNDAFAFKRNNKFELNVTLRLRIKQKYTSRPYEKIIEPSKYPAIYLEYKKALPGIAGSIADYDFLRVQLRDRINLRLLGNLYYYFSYGNFIRIKNIFFMDYYHFDGNQTLFSNFDLRKYHLLPYYTYSTRNYFIEIHAEQRFGGFILNKIPLIKKLRLDEVAGVHFLHTQLLSQYTEVFFGIEKLNIFRIDYAIGFSSDKQISNGIRLGLKIR